jgi:heat shock protein HtpX
VVQSPLLKFVGRFLAGLFVALSVVVAVPMLLLSVLSSWPVWAALLSSVVVAAVCCIGVWFVVRRLLSTADQVLLRLAKAVPADARQHARLFNLVEGLSATSGVAAPSLYVIDDAAPNSMTVGPAPSSGQQEPPRASLAVTTGLLQSLNRMELEGALAHEMARVKTNESATSTAAMATTGLPLLVSDRLAAGESSVGLRVLGLLTKPLSNRSSAKLSGESSGDATLLADQTAASFTRYPPGLIGALNKIDQHRGSAQIVAPSTLHLWSVAPHGSASTSQLPIPARIASLDEL